MSSDDDMTNNLPNHYEDLEEEDKREYNQIRSIIQQSGRNHRGKRLEAFSELLDTLKNFAVRGDSNDWKRCLVVGVCWLENAIAINTRQLRQLTNKCKSSINGSLQRIGYMPVANHSLLNDLLQEKIPFLKGNFSELRQWTIRQQVALTPKPAMPEEKTKLSPAPVNILPIPTNIETSNAMQHSQSYEQNITEPENEPVNQNDYNSFYDEEACLPLNDWVQDDNFYDFGSNL
ncbi:hypothetical protein TVAG_226480 [Trichomonas vaginalis G3]|uniref:Initiator binding domain-containing protein n=1 Tax=Trichomonas vaginalis (strain ATCC PRA-98 / G3) TaxID=412133 RepID=A2ER82_TRIV3|nr:transcription-initiator DNA-binding domain ibd family [Trichomonas vaginalis G3]EAY04835.1 hypothetical protein TVAG_226480 [Trichomonas vaginalis G3]KAI5535357.1 transcription-initiator DNA-binding domain ibd family [Trichomonas vaginalis G3]|eukprot:XP_001317058.1 hypothetical protein [Trichomonas vaginalis G3]